MSACKRCGLPEGCGIGLCEADCDEPHNPGEGTIACRDREIAKLRADLAAKAELAPERQGVTALADKWLKQAAQMRLEGGDYRAFEELEACADELMALPVPAPSAGESMAAWVPEAGERVAYAPNTVELGTVVRTLHIAYVDWDEGHRGSHEVCVLKPARPHPRASGQPAGAEVSEPSQALAFVRPELDQGPILAVTGAFFDEVHAAGWDISDHNIATPTTPGLQIFEGWVDVGPGDDPDVRWEGGWRPLSHWELCRLRFGMTPFQEKP